MSDTVIVLKGDSSQLVGELGKSGKAMDGVKADAKKLTDQLRDVADEADIAAGKLVNKIGGPNAIKAIGGIGIAFTGVNAAIGVLSDSMNSFYATQGKEGADAINTVNTAVDSLKGSLFEAATGGADAADSAEVLAGALGSLKTAVDVILFPLRSFVALISQAGKDHSFAAEQARKNADAEKEFAAVMAGSTLAVNNMKAAYSGVERMVISLIGTKKQLAVFDLEQQKVQLAGALRLMEANAAPLLIAQARLAGARAESEQLAKERAALLDDFPESRYYRTVNRRRVLDVKRREADIQEAIANSAAAQVRIVEASTRAIQAASNSEAFFKKSGLDKYRDNIRLALDQMDELIEQAKKGVFSTGGGGGGGGRPASKQTAEEMAAEWKRLEQIKQIREENIRKFMDLGVGTDAYTMRLFTLMATLPASLLSDVSDITKKGLYELAKPLEMLETYSPGDPIVRQVAERMRAFRDAVEPAMSDAMQLAFSIALKTNTLIPLEKRLGYSVAQSIVESAKALAQEIDTTETKKAIEDLMQKKAQPLPENLTLDDDPEIDRLKRRAAEMTKVLGKHYDWRELRDAETNKILDDADAKVLESKSKNIERYMVAYGQSIADQIVAGDSASEIMEATAKKAMANIISFIGDEAMAKGAMMAAEGNPMAIAMFAAGTAAYATAAYLGSTAKKSNATTSASSGSSAPSNSYYNLRVDATFADGESIARRFAQMQKAASQRGLIPQGAY